MNVMPLRIMKEMGLEVTHPYGNVCGIDSRGVQTYGLIKNLKADLFACPDLNTMMDVVVIDLPLFMACCYLGSGLLDWVDI